jgi:hypothetical protein
MTCQTKINLSYRASVATTATELTAANQEIRDHIAGCQECQERQRLELAAIRAMMERIQTDDGAILAGEIS